MFYRSGWVLSSKFIRLFIYIHILYPMAAHGRPMTSLWSTDPARVLELVWGLFYLFRNFFRSLVPLGRYMMIYSNFGLRYWPPYGRHGIKIFKTFSKSSPGPIHLIYYLFRSLGHVMMIYHGYVNLDLRHIGVWPTYDRPTHAEVS